MNFRWRQMEKAVKRYKKYNLRLPSWEFKYFKLKKRMKASNPLKFDYKYKFVPEKMTDLEPIVMGGYFIKEAIE